MPNLNAALLLAQLENLDVFLQNKRETALAYEDFFSGKDFHFIKEPKNSKSNYWLNAIILKDLKHRNLFLEETKKLNWKLEVTDKSKLAGKNGNIEELFYFTK